MKMNNNEACIAALSETGLQMSHIWRKLAQTTQKKLVLLGDFNAQVCQDCNTRGSAGDIMLLANSNGQMLQVWDYNHKLMKALWMHPQIKALASD